MIRALCLAGGLAGALGLSQFPEFSQQYLQRLGGQVDELTQNLKQLDEMALDRRMGREAYLEDMVARNAANAAFWRGQIVRHARLGENLEVLRAATPLQRIAMPHRFADPAMAQAVWSDFSPAVPATTAGAASAGVGFLGGWALLAAVFGAIRAPFRRFKSRPTSRAQKVESDVRREPVVARPTLVSQPEPFRPKLAGVQR